MKQALFVIMLLGNWAMLQAQSGQDSLHGKKDDPQLHISPNPAVCEVHFTWTMHKAAPVTLTLVDLEGCMSLSINLGEVPPSTFTKSVYVEAFDPGTYIASLAIEGRIYSKTFIVQEE